MTQSLLKLSLLIYGHLGHKHIYTYISTSKSTMSLYMLITMKCIYIVYLLKRRNAGY